MTFDDAKKVQSIVFALADGASMVFPVAAPFVRFVEEMILHAEQNGITPLEISTEQQAAIAAGMAAARSSSVTEHMAHSSMPATSQSRTPLP